MINGFEVQSSVTSGSSRRTIIVTRQTFLSCSLGLDGLVSSSRRK